jgi:hypothetical protein
MTENDIKTGKELLQEAFIMKNPEWMKELHRMVSARMNTVLEMIFVLASFHYARWYRTNLNLGQIERKGRDSGAFLIRLSIRHGGVPSPQVSIIVLSHSALPSMLSSVWKTDIFLQTM